MLISCCRLMVLLQRARRVSLHAEGEEEKSGKRGKVTSDEERRAALQTREGAGGWMVMWNSQWDAAVAAASSKTTDQHNKNGRKQEGKTHGEGKRQTDAILTLVSTCLPLAAPPSLLRVPFSLFVYFARHAAVYSCVSIQVECEDSHHSNEHTKQHSNKCHTYNCNHQTHLIRISILGLVLPFLPFSPSVCPPPLPTRTVSQPNHPQQRVTLHTQMSTLWHHHRHHLHSALRLAHRPHSHTGMRRRRNTMRNTNTNINITTTIMNHHTYHHHQHRLISSPALRHRSPLSVY